MSIKFKLNQYKNNNNFYQKKLTFIKPTNFLLLQTTVY